MSSTVSAADSSQPRRFRPSVPGERRGGRPKGGVNKYNGDIKKMVVGALELVGGVQYLARQAEKNPVAFLGLVGRVLPLQVTGADGGKLHIEFSWADEPKAQAPTASLPHVIEANAEPAADAQLAEAVEVTFAGE